MLNVDDPDRGEMPNACAAATAPAADCLVDIELTMRPFLSLMNAILDVSSYSFSAKFYLDFRARVRPKRKI